MIIDVKPDKFSRIPHVLLLYTSEIDERNDSMSAFTLWVVFVDQIEREEICVKNMLSC